MIDVTHNFPRVVLDPFAVERQERQNRPHLHAHRIVLKRAHGVSFSARYSTHLLKEILIAQHLIQKNMAFATFEGQAETVSLTKHKTHTYTRTHTNLAS